MKIKKALCKLIVFTLVLNTIFLVSKGTASATNKREAALKTYEKFLKRGNAKLKIDGILQKFDFSQERFSIKDLNHDGVPELIINTMRGSLNSVVLTYYNGKIKTVLGCYHAYPKCYKKGSVFAVDTLTNGVSILSMYKIKKGKAVKVAELTDDSARYDSKGKKYYINNKKVGKSKYNKYINKLTKSTASSIADLEYYTFPEIKSVLSESQ